VVSAGRYLGLITQQSIYSALRTMHSMPEFRPQSQSA
jgi:hypothetical protein